MNSKATSLFIFEATEKATGRALKFPCHHVSRLSAYNALRKEYGHFYKITYA